MTYTVPLGDAANFVLEEYTVPQGDVANFQLEDEVTVKIKLSGTIVEKPLMIKIGGVVKQASAITVKTT